MYFGDFLVQEKVISEEQLVSALIFQSSKLPNVVEILDSNKCLGPKEILQAFSIQTKEKIEFISALKKLNLWKNEYLKIIENEVSKVKIPLGQILSEQGAISPKDLVGLLEKFLLLKKENNDTLINEETPSASAEPELHFNLGILDQDLVSEYTDLFNEELYNKIIKVFSSEPADFNQLNNTFNALKILQGAAKFANAEISFEMLSFSQKFIFSKVKAKKALTPSESELLFESIEALWDLRGRLLSDSSEESFWEGEKNKKLFQKLCKKLNT